MIRVRKTLDRGHANHGWLDSYHTFSFADYYDPAHMNFRALRVINEDWIEPGQGFGMHGHKDMEIVTYILEGSLEHRDSLGNGEVLRAGELQRMTAGSGIRHSEFNPSKEEKVHLYQIWLLPDRKGLEPGYEQRRFHAEAQAGQFRLAASPTGRDDSLKIHQDADVSLAVLEPGQRAVYPFRPSRHGWLQIVRGQVEANGVALAACDGAAISDESRLELASSAGPVEVILFDLN